MIQRFLATKPEYLSAATLLLAGVEQGNVSNEEFIEDVARSECVYHRLYYLKKYSMSETRSFLTSELKAPSSCLFKNILRAQNRFFSMVLKLTMTSLRTKRKINKFACSKIFFFDVRHVVCFDFPPAHADRNECSSRLCNRLRLFRIIWKQLFTIVCYLRSSAIICDHMETSLI